MLCIVFVVVFDTEVVYHQGEVDRARSVGPEARGVLARVVAMCSEAFDEQLLCNHTSLGQTIHAATNFNVDFAIMDLVHEVVLVDDFLRDDVNVEEHVFVAFHWCPQVKVFNIDTHEFGIGSGGNAVEEDFGSLALTSPGKSMRLPPTVRRVHSCSSLWGLRSTTMRP